MNISFMKKILFLLTSLLFVIQFSTAQKEYINRKIAQKNYEGYLLMQQEKYDSALFLFNEALTEDSEAFFIYQNRALCHLMLKDTANAISDYKTNIRLEPQNAESCYALGNIYKARQDSVNAKNLFLQSIEKSDTSFSQVKLVYMYNFIARVCFEDGRFDSALVYFNKVKFYKPYDSNSFINSAACNFLLDSTANFCNDLEKAYVLGGAVTCKILSSFCTGCQHLQQESNRPDTLSNALDARLLMVLDSMPGTEPPVNVLLNDNFAENRKVKVYFNKFWQICPPENARFYREAFWSQSLNFFGGTFTDFYADGKTYAKGEILNKKMNGDFISFYKNGNTKTEGRVQSGIPVGKWKYYQENGEPDYFIDFDTEPFKIEIQNKNNPNYSINSGDGSFEITLDNWEGLKTVVSGEFSKFNKNGEWQYRRGSEVLVQEKYKNGIFKNGYISTASGKVTISDKAIDKSLLLPPYINQIYFLYFDSIDAVTYYPFIRVQM